MRLKRGRRCPSAPAATGGFDAVVSLPGIEQLLEGATTMAATQGVQMAEQAQAALMQ
ncbi:hypothetical protein [Streptomyces sp. NPDC046832]|uniref:hypothetical protein n=1 Tax=Streptomyces sp. NPDC046832 TaxID=3155020 RepID=UPI00340904D4